LKHRVAAAKLRYHDAKKTRNSKIIYKAKASYERIRTVYRATKAKANRAIIKAQAVKAQVKVSRARHVKAHERSLKHKVSHLRQKLHIIRRTGSKVEVKVAIAKLSIAQKRLAHVRHAMHRAIREKEHALIVAARAKVAVKSHAVRQAKKECKIEHAERELRKAKAHLRKVDRH